MLADDGRLVFLDFGLMSGVEEPIMEAFASGIQCVLSKDYVGLVQAFIDTGFVGSPIEWRAKEEDPWQLTHPDGDTTSVMAKELQERMEACPGGGSRFGALSIVLGDMGFFWQMYTPPYVILLIRTFLTLEGIAGKVDPNFNIYEVALPWAVQRALSPSTDGGVKALRQAVLDERNQFQWQRVEELIEQRQAEQQEAKEAATRAAASGAEGEADSAALPEASSARARLMAQEANKAEIDPVLASAGAEAQAAQAATPLDSLTKVLGSTNGATLRRIARDLDSTELMLRLSSPEARPLRRLAVAQLAAAFEAQLGESAKAVRRLLERGGKSAATDALAASAVESVAGVVVPTRQAAAPTTSDEASTAVTQPWPSSLASTQLEQRLSARAKTASKLLLRLHLRRQLMAGWRGAAAVSALAWVCLRVALAAGVRALVRLTATAAASVLPKPFVAAMAGAAAGAASVLARELQALGASLGALGDELSQAQHRTGQDDSGAGAVGQ